MLKAFATRATEALSRLVGALWRQLLLSGVVWLGFSAGSAGGSTAPKCLLVRPLRSAPASSLRVAAARKGKAVAVWCEGSYGGRVLRVMNVGSGAGWRRERPLTAGAWDEGEVKSAINSAGAAIVVWTRSDNGFREVVGAGYHPRSGWNHPVVLDSSGGGFSPEVSVDEGGNAIAVWNRAEPEAEGYSVMAARYSAGGWSAAVVLHRDATSPAPSLSGNASGEAVVMWTGLYWDQGVRRHHAFAARFHPDSGWGKAVELGDAVNEREEMVADETTALPGVYQPVVALDEEGNAVALWQEVRHEQEASRLMVSRFESRKGWGRPQLLAQDALDYSLAMGAGGAAHVCWTQSVNVSYLTSYVSSVSLATFAPGEGWLTNKLLRCHPYLCRNLIVTAGRQGDLLVTWVNWAGDAGELWSLAWTPSKGWGEPAALEGAKGITGYHISAGDDRAFVMAWSEEGSEGTGVVKVLQLEI